MITVRTETGTTTMKTILLAAVRGALDSTDADDLKAKTTALETAFHKASEQIYAKAQAQSEGGGESGSTNGGDPEEEVVDAEVVEEEK